MEIKIKTNNPLLAHQIQQDIPSHIVVSVQAGIEKRDMSSSDIIITISIAAAQVLAPKVLAWLISKRLVEHSTNITINKKEVVLNEGEIKRVIEENIRIEQQK